MSAELRVATTPELSWLVEKTTGQSSLKKKLPGGLRIDPDGQHILQSVFVEEVDPDMPIRVRALLFVKVQESRKAFVGMIELWLDDWRKLRTLAEAIGDRDEDSMRHLASRKS